MWSVTKLSHWKRNRQVSTKDVTAQQYEDTSEHWRKQGSQRKIRWRRTKTAPKHRWRSTHTWKETRRGPNPVEGIRNSRQWRGPEIHQIRTNARTVSCFILRKQETNEDHLKKHAQKSWQYQRNDLIRQKQLQGSHYRWDALVVYASSDLGFRHWHGTKPVTWGPGRARLDKLNQCKQKSAPVK